MRFLVCLFITIAMPISSFGDCSSALDSRITSPSIVIKSIENYETFRNTVAYVDGNLSFSFAGVREPIEIDLPLLTGVSGEISFSGGSLKGTLKIPRLVKVGGNLKISSASYPNLYLKRVYLPSLREIGEFKTIRLVGSGIENPATDVILGTEVLRDKLWLE